MNEDYEAPDKWSARQQEARPSASNKPKLLTLK